MREADVEQALERARQGITNYLETARASGKIDQPSFEAATAATIPNLTTWLTDPNIDDISRGLRSGITQAIQAERWEDLVNAFRQKLRFGTGGIRGMMAFDRGSIVRLKDEGIDTDILKGTNTINDLVFLLTSAGVAQFGKDQNDPFETIVIGYDSRIRGHDLAQKIAELFLAYDYTVYFFDEPVPYPEVTYAIPYVKADVGILISASHNDYRYNGYKLSCSNGSQFDPAQREEMYDNYISKATTKDIKLVSFSDASGKLHFLGGAEPAPGYDYHGKEGDLINLHAPHREHVKGFLMTPDLPEQQKSAKDPLHVAFCAFHGAGRVAVPRLLKEVGIQDVKSITVDGLNDLNGLFPSFKSAPGEEQQPDPGDPRAAEVAVNAFNKEYPSVFDEETDILIGTDPDADRCGIVVKVPKEQEHVYGGKNYVLLPADDMWTLLVWYRLERERQAFGSVQDAATKFLVLSHTTSEGIAKLANKHHIGTITTWVGFASLAAAARDVWHQTHGAFNSLVDGRDDKWENVCHPYVCSDDGMDGTRSFNIAALEQSNGFSLLGGPPPDQRSLGTGGHVRDKDGTLAALLVAEVAAWAKSQGSSIIELLDANVYLDPDIGLFMTFYEPDPLDGEYPGIEGDRQKIAILRRAWSLYHLAKAGDLEIGGLPALDNAVIYRTGKYDVLYPATHEFQFPDEGFRFYFSEDKLNHVTIRPSGTGNSLRFHIQLHTTPTKANLIEEKGSPKNPRQSHNGRSKKTPKSPTQVVSSEARDPHQRSRRSYQGIAMGRSTSSLERSERPPTSFPSLVSKHCDGALDR